VSGLLLTVRYADGTTPASFFGTVRQQGAKPVQIDCGSPTVECSPTMGQVRVFVDPVAPLPIYVALHSPDGRTFSGTITPDLSVIHDFNGPGCGDCSSLSAKVVLE
jgi:hypothetical protein